MRLRTRNLSFPIKFRKTSIWMNMAKHTRVPCAWKRALNFAPFQTLVEFSFAFVFCCCFPWIWFNVQIWVGTLAIFIVFNRFCWCDFGARARQTILWYWISKCITQIYRNIYKFNNFYELVFWIKWLLLLFSKTRRKKRLRTIEREKPSALCVIVTEGKKIEATA